jgi:hypothetical protein
MLNPFLGDLETPTELNETAEKSPEDVELQSLLALAASEPEDMAHLYLPHLETATHANTDEIGFDELSVPVLQIEEAVFPEFQQPMPVSLSEMPQDSVKEDNFKSLPDELKKMAEKRAKHALCEGRVKCNEQSIKSRIEKKYPNHGEDYLAYYKELLLIGSKDIDKKTLVSALARKRGTDAVKNVKTLDFDKLERSAMAEFGKMTDFYCSIYCDAFETAKLKAEKRKAEKRKTAEHDSSNTAFKVNVLTDVKKMATERACIPFKVRKTTDQDSSDSAFKDVKRMAAGRTFIQFKVPKTTDQGSSDSAFVLPDVKRVATERASKAFTNGRIMFCEDRIRRSAEKIFPEHVGAYLAYYKEALEIKCKDFKNEDLICKLAKSRGRALAKKFATLHIQTLNESAVEFGDMAELYRSTYCTAFYAQRSKIDKKKCESQDATLLCRSDIEESCEIQQMSNPNNFLPSYQGLSRKKPEPELENRSTSKCGI